MDKQAEHVRDRLIVRTSLVAIGTNLCLVAFKMAVGLLANSIAIVLDAMNNLSDALSSVITILGTKLAGRPPDKKHLYQKNGPKDRLRRPGGLRDRRHL